MIFGVRRLLFLKSGRMCPPPKKFFTVFTENTVFFKKIRIKNIPHLICDKKGYIDFWCNMTKQLWGKQNKGWRGRILTSSYALPAPEIFLHRLADIFNFKTVLKSRHDWRMEQWSANRRLNRYSVQLSLFEVYRIIND